KPSASALSSRSHRTRQYASASGRSGSSSRKSAPVPTRRTISAQSCDTCSTSCGRSSTAGFFFEAEDGIRVLYVTGVQTCALPISMQELSGRGTAARRARPERQDPARHRRRHAAAPVRRGQQRCERRPRGRSLRPRADPRPRDLHAPRHRSALRPARVVHPVGTRGRGRGARPQRHGDAEDRPRQPAAPGAAPARQGHAAAARARQRRRLLSPAAGGPAEAQRRATRGPGGLRVGVEGAARSARQRVHRKNEEAPGLIMSSRYWELTVAVSPDASEGLTNFVWELGALGVVEEENAAGRARLRAFFPEAADSDAIAKSIDLYLGALESLGFARTGGPAVSDVADTDWAEAWRAHFAPLPLGRRLLVTPPWETPPPADGR